MKAPSRFVLAIYRSLVNLTPRQARERFAHEQVQLFEQLWREERPTAGTRAIAWTLAHLWRAARASMAHWFDHLFRRRREHGDLTIGGRPGGGWRAPILLDVRYAARGLWRAPWYTLTTIGVLSASVALVTTAFAVVDGVLFKPLPYARATELHLVRVDITAKPTADPPPVAGWDLGAWAEALPDLGVTGVGRVEPYWLESVEYGSVGVDEHFFEVLGTRPLIGGFMPEDFDAQANNPETPAGFWRPIVVSYAIWQRKFGGDPSVIGRPITYASKDGRRKFGYRIRGVLPRNFTAPLDLGRVAPEILTPTSAREMRDDFNRGFDLIVRIPAATNVANVRDRLLGATRRRALAPPRVVDPGVFGHSDAARWRPEFDDVRLIPLADHLGWRNRQAFVLVFVAAATLLLLACVNVAGLATGRSLDRRRELAVRRALGASGWALSRELLAEVGLLAVLSTGAALLIAQPLLKWTLDLLPTSAALLKTPAIDERVFAASGLFALTVVALVVWWPARVAHRISLLAEFGRGGGAMTRPGRQSTFVLVTAQIALAFVLLSAGGLTVTSLAKTWSADAGYDRDRLLVFPAFVEGYDMLPKGEASARVSAFSDVLRGVPGVQSVTTSNHRLFRGTGDSWTEVVPRGWSGELVGVQSTLVDASYFNVLDLPLLDGRWPQEGEWTDSSSFAIVSQTAARRFWPDGSAVGQVLVTPQRRASQPVTTRTVIAVVGDARYRSLDQDPISDIYLPYTISSSTYGRMFIIRTVGPAREMLEPLVAIATAKGLWVEEPATFRDKLFAAARHRVLPAWLFGSLGAVALLVLAAGILGLFVMSIARRTREMGIRVALGASTQRIVGLLIREQLRAVWLGLAAGAVISTWTVRGLASQLYGVGPYDPVVWSAVALTMVAIATLATIVPATRAARVDPVVILKTE